MFEVRLQSYFTIRYVRSPAAFFDDSIFCPPLLPSTLTNRMRLPASRFYDLGQCHALLAREEVEDLRLLAALARVRAALSARGARLALGGGLLRPCLLGRARCRV